MSIKKVKKVTRKKNQSVTVEISLVLSKETKKAITDLLKIVKSIPVKKA